MCDLVIWKVTAQDLFKKKNKKKKDKTSGNWNQVICLVQVIPAVLKAQREPWVNFLTRHSGLRVPKLGDGTGYLCIWIRFL